MPVMETFLGWFDDSAKKPVQTKIAEAVERFNYKFGFAPDVCLVHEGEEIEFPGVTIRPARHIRPNYFWVGREDMSAVLPPEAPAEPAEAAATPVAETPAPAIPAVSTAKPAKRTRPAA